MDTYLITNENLSTYNDIYNFAGKDVLTVIGSGDQYFTCKLFGANRVDVFDYNKEAWYLFALKFMALRNLSYEDFYCFIMSEKMKDIETYKRLKQFLPDDAQDYFDSFYDYFFPCVERYKGPKYGDGSIIPYFDVDNYYKLQDILSKEELPTYYWKNIMVLPYVLKGPYDIMLASNIYGWLHDAFVIKTPAENPTEYKNLLDKFPIDVIQANYWWYKTGDEFTDAGYHETIIPSVIDSGNNNYVYTYTKNGIMIPKRIGV